MDEPQISIIIPAHNAAATLSDTLAGLGAQRTEAPFEVIVVDDRSSDETPSIAERSAVVDMVVRADGAGPARARNAGAAAAGADRLAFLDADCVPTLDWLSAGLRALEEAEFVVGETRPRLDRVLGPFDRTLWVVGSSPLFESANLFVRRELFERLDGFESWLGPRNGKELGEDVWFGWRAVRAGARIASCPQALVHHEVYPRGIVGYAAERWRLRFFPAMVRRMPELRSAFLHRRYFLSARSARFDAALVGLGVSALTRWPLPAAAAIPYAQAVFRDLRNRDGLRLASALLAADAIGCAALLLGSARSRSLLV